MRIILIGRDTPYTEPVDIDLTPFDPLNSVSRLHAEILEDDDGAFFIMDKGSTNGTYVNGRQVASGAVVALNKSDAVTVGCQTLRFNGKEWVYDHSCAEHGVL